MDETTLALEETSIQQSVNEVFSAEYFAALNRCFHKSPQLRASEAEGKLFVDFVERWTAKRPPRHKDAPKGDVSSPQVDVELENWPSVEFLVGEALRTLPTPVPVSGSGAAASSAPPLETDSHGAPLGADSAPQNALSQRQPEEDAVLFRQRVEETRQQGTVRYRDACRAVRFHSLLRDASRHTLDRAAELDAVKCMIECLRSLYEPTPPPPVAEEPPLPVPTKAPFPATDPSASLVVLQRIAAKDSEGFSEPHEDSDSSMMVNPRDILTVAAVAEGEGKASDEEEEEKSEAREEKKRRGKGYRDKRLLKKHLWPPLPTDGVGEERTDQGRLVLAHHRQLMDPDEFVKKLHMGRHSTYGYLPDTVSRTRSRSRSGGKSGHSSFLRPKKGSRKSRKKGGKKKKKEAEFYGKKRSLAWEVSPVDSQDWPYEEYGAAHYAPVKRTRLSRVMDDPSITTLSGVVLSADSVSVTPQPRVAMPDHGED